ncbi:hypothetical protein BDZ91DRAFT_376443 [Kalaharituber pfeilii]|nr:hypothetical protein BDZ91DRAFT_376443 [Kalaharituber pfeilii]
MDNPESSGSQQRGWRQSMKGMMHNAKRAIKSTIKSSDALAPPLDNRLSRSQAKSDGATGHARTSSAPPANRPPLIIPHIAAQTVQQSTSSRPDTTLVSSQSAKSQTVANSVATVLSHSSKEQSGAPPNHDVKATGSLYLTEEDSVVPQNPPQSLQSSKIRGNIELIIEALQSAKEDVKKGQWQYTNSRGERVVVVERLGRILKGVQHYAGIVDVAIQHSPETTALIWAGVRFILQVSDKILPHADS